MIIKEINLEIKNQIKWRCSTSVEIQWPKLNRWGLLCYFFFSYFSFTLTFSSTFLLLFLVLLFLFLSPKTWTPDTPSAGQPPAGTTLRRTAQNFALFFPAPATIFILLSLSTGSLVELVFCKARTLRASGRGLQTCTFQGPGASNTTQIRRRTPKRGREEWKLWREKGKKRKILGLPPSGPYPVWSQKSNSKLAEVEIGRSRNWPKSNWPISKRKAGRSRNWPKSIAPKSHIMTVRNISLTFWPKQVSREMSGVFSCV